MLRPTDRARLEALVESDDTAITLRDRIEAIKLLRGLGSPGDLEPGAIEMAAWAQSLSGEELDAALRDYFDPGFIGKSVAPKVMTPDYRAQMERARREMHEEALAQARAA